jgi:hypothetical protein
VHCRGEISFAWNHSVDLANAFLDAVGAELGPDVAVTNRSAASAYVTFTADVDADDEVAAYRKIEEATKRAGNRTIGSSEVDPAIAVFSERNSPTDERSDDEKPVRLQWVLRISDPLTGRILTDDDPPPDRGDGSVRVPAQPGPKSGSGAAAAEIEDS